MEKKGKFHFIGSGSGISTDLAIALTKSGSTVTISGEVFSDESKSKLLKANILPEKAGWLPERLNEGLKAVIIGPGIRPDNPELKRAQELKLRMLSIPEFIYDYAIDKQRIVVAGSTGKNIISLLIIHTLAYHKRKFDYVVSAPPAGKDSSVLLSNAPLIIIEGQEVSSSQDATPDFLKYHHHIGVLSDIEWNPGVKVSRDDYVKQFGLFETGLPK
ncbi:MAG TPA: peptidoglycan synthetase, partial [Cyclobacteriaceae bacterium]|nr:peptidoglycan synthetase [Cyclobacteriaceae bacterium]